MDTGQAFVVAPVADPEDWVACFVKAPDFPALEWAERMVDLYNAAPVGDRLRPAAAPEPLPRTGYHPFTVPPGPTHPTPPGSLPGADTGRSAASHSSVLPSVL